MHLQFGACDMTRCVNGVTGHNTCTVLSVILTDKVPGIVRERHIYGRVSCISMIFGATLSE